jgi:hypothetical protein
MEIKQIAEGAFFVPSYSEQTIIPFEGMITAQTITSVEEEDEPKEKPTEIGSVYKSVT